MKQAMVRRILSLGISMMLVVSVPVQAFADTWYIDQGDINIHVDDAAVQTVSQSQSEGVVSRQDESPVVTNSNPSVSTDNTITVDTAAGQTAEFTIQDVNIGTSGAEGAAIDIGESSAVVTVSGDNTLSTVTPNLLGEGDAAVHVTSGNLTLTSENGGSLNAAAYNSIGGNAAIGSNDHEDMTGTITIAGDVQVNAKGGVGAAAIGSGAGGAMSGDIEILGEASVTAQGVKSPWSGSNSTGIGGGSEDGKDMTGSIHIGENATVVASGSGAGAGIGTYQNADMNGTICIDGNANVTATASDLYYGAAIGGGWNSEVNGTITIAGQAVVSAASASNSAAIGTYGNNPVNGTIEILDTAEVTTQVLTGNGQTDNTQPGMIGSGGTSDHSRKEGSFLISTEAKINGKTHHSPDTLEGFINFHKDGNGNPTNLTFVSAETGEEPPEKPEGAKAVAIAEQQAQENTAAIIRSYPLYQVLDKDGNSILHVAVLESGILTISAQTDYAQLLVYGGNLRELMRLGVTEIIFQSNDGVSQYSLAQVYKAMPSGTSRLTHDGEAVSFTLNGTGYIGLVQ